MLGAKWGDAAPVFQILVIAALGQLLFESAVWLFVSRGQSGRLLKLLLISSPLIFASFAIGLPFGIKGVAWAGSLGMILLLPWILNFTFRGTQLTLRRLGRAILYPISVCLVSIFLADLCLRLIHPERVPSQLLITGLGFLAGYALSVIIPAVRKELLSFRDLLVGIGHSRQSVEQLTETPSFES